MLSVGDVLRAHKAHSVECFLAPGDGSAGEVWVAEAWLTLDDPLDGRNAVRGSGPSPEAAIDLLGRKLAEDDRRMPRPARFSRAPRESDSEAGS